MIAALLAFGLAWAQEDDPLSEHTVGSVVSPAIEVEPPTLDTPVPVASQVAAAALGADVAQVEATRAALELLYERRYKEARKAFDALTTRYPTSGIGPVGVALLYQALMFENFDFRYEQPYRLAADQAKSQLALGAKEPGNDAFEAFLGAGLAAVDAILALRKGEYVGALDRALYAMRLLDRTKQLAPGFADTRLGDGMYLYWRTVVTKSSSLLPDFPDKRAEGLAFMRQAETEAVFLAPGATLTLAYAYIEERKLQSALDRSLALRMRYADNVINNMTIGRVYTSLRRYPDALRVYDEVLGDDPHNQRVHYFRGIVLARAGKPTDALKAFQTYVGFRDVPAPLRSAAWFRIGATYETLKDDKRAIAAYEQAMKAHKHEAARRAITRLKEK